MRFVGEVKVRILVLGAVRSRSLEVHRGLERRMLRLGVARTEEDDQVGQCAHHDCMCTKARL